MNKNKTNIVESIEKIIENVMNDVKGYTVKYSVYNTKTGEWDATDPVKITNVGSLDVRAQLYDAKGEKAGQKLTAKTGRYGLFMALLLFVGIPLPGTGAWTGTLAASFLNMGFKSTVLAVCLGVILAGIIMAVASTGVFSIIGLT